MDKLVTYRVDAARAQSHLRRYIGLSAAAQSGGRDRARGWGGRKDQVVEWLRHRAGGTQGAAGSFEKLVEGGSPGSRSGRPEAVQADGDMDGEFVTPGCAVRDRGVGGGHRAPIRRGRGLRLSNGLHKTYWEVHADRDALEVKAEVIVLAREKSSGHGPAWRPTAEDAFDALYDHAQEGHRPSSRKQRRPITSDCAWPRPSLRRCPGICRNPSTSTARRKRSAMGSPSLSWRAKGNSVPVSGTWEAGAVARKNWRIRGWSAGCATWTASPGRWKSPTRRGGAVRPMFPDLPWCVRNVGTDITRAIFWNRTTRP